nr:phosphatase PAP2 family protein [Geodermatophilus sp. Leaf369]
MRVDLLLLRSTRARLGGTPAVPVARGLSHFGEHGLGWLALGGAGWAVARNRGDWPRSLAAIVAAHATGVVVKRLVRRPRPALDDVPPLVRTAGRLSFPSAHCCSTAAAAVAFAPVFGRPLMAGALVAMGVSRVLLGVHYPSDVLAGSAIGGLVAAGFNAAGPRAPRKAFS